MEHRSDWYPHNHTSNRPSNPPLVVLGPNHEFGTLISGALSSRDLGSPNNMAEGCASDLDSWEEVSMPSPESIPNEHPHIEFQTNNNSGSQNGQIPDIPVSMAYDILSTGPVGLWTNPLDQPPFTLMSMDIQPSHEGFDPLYSSSMDRLHFNLQELNEIPSTSHQGPILSPAHSLSSHQNFDPVAPYISMNTRSISQGSSDSSHNFFMSQDWSVIESSPGIPDTTSIHSSEHIDLFTFNFQDVPQVGPSTTIPYQDNIAIKYEETSLDSNSGSYNHSTITSPTNITSQEVPVIPSSSRDTSTTIRKPNKSTTKNAAVPKSQGMQHTFNLNGGREVKNDSKPNGKKVGGRPRGKHLDENVAARARQMREVGACWNCALQRETCSGAAGEPCERCEARRQRSTMEAAYSLGCCSRTKLYDLRDEFIPDIVTRFHKDHAVQDYLEQNIKTFVHGSTYSIEIDAIWKLPRIKCQLYEFQPLNNINGSHMTLQGGKFVYSRPKCIPLALSQTNSRNKQDMEPFDTYVQKLVNENLEDFANICYKSLEDSFMDRLIHLLVKYTARDSKDDEILSHCFRLLFSIHIFTHALSIPKDQFRHLVGRLHPEYLAELNHDAGHWYPRVANRQLKYFFLGIAQTSMDQLLNKMQRILAASSGKTRWISAFVCMISLGMAIEELQSTIVLICKTEVERGSMDKRTADDTFCRSCKAMDDQYLLMIQIFQGKYGRANPLRDSMDETKRTLLGESGVELLLGIKKLVEDHGLSYLLTAQYECPLPATADKFYARLCSRFISSFFWPSSSR